MPREPKPYVERGWYVSRPSGEYLRLCPAEAGLTEAKKLLRLELARLEKEREQMGGRSPTRLTVTELCLLFLEDAKVTKDEDTFLYYQRWCTEFAKKFGNRSAKSISKADANEFKLHLCNFRYVRGKQPGKLYSPKTVNHALIVIRRAFNWAIENDYLPMSRNSFNKLKLLPCNGRRRVATEEEYRKLLENCSDEAFRDVLVAMRFTCARPQDIYSLTWAMVDWKSRMWVLTEHKGSRTATNPKPRIIPMNTEVERVILERARSHGQNGCVFLNSEGKPWTKNALGLRMRRLRNRAGVGPDEHGEQFVLYTNRHTFLTQAGADPNISQSTLAEIAGHTDPRTTSRYIHAQKLVVAEAARRVADTFTDLSLASAG